MTCQLCLLFWVIRGTHLGLGLGFRGRVWVVGGFWRGLVCCLRSSRTDQMRSNLLAVRLQLDKTGHYLSLEYGYIS